MIVTRMGCLIATIASSVGSLPVSHWAAAPSGGEKTQSFKSNAGFYNPFFPHSF